MISSFDLIIGIIKKKIQSFVKLNVNMLKIQKFSLCKLLKFFFFASRFFFN